MFFKHAGEDKRLTVAELAGALQNMKHHDEGSDADDDTVGPPGGEDRYLAKARDFVEKCEAHFATNSKTDGHLGWEEVRDCYTKDAVDGGMLKAEVE